MKKSLFYFGLFSFMISFGIISCKKDTAAVVETTTEDNLISQDLEEEIDYDINSQIDFRGCPIVTWAQPQGTFPNVVTLDFGNGCSNTGFRTKKGKLRVALSSSFLTPGATRTVTFDGFSIDDVTVTGIKTTTNQGLTNNVWSLSRNADLTFLFPNGKSSTWKPNYVIAWVEGSTTLSVADDVFNMTGSATGTDRNGVAYQCSITSPLVRNRICNWISKGTLEVTALSKTYKLDFGNGECDQKAVVTDYNGNTKEIRIRRWW